VSKKIFIESPSFPVEVINRASASEKGGGGRPEHWEMVFWWTRKPLAGARAVILASLLGETDTRAFLRWLYPSIRFLDEGEKCRKKSTSRGGKEAGICFEETPHRSNPTLPPEVRERLRGVKLLDPFAGFGSIPLEAVRLGVGEVVAVELLPTAYVFLKAVLEHPKAYGGRVVRVSGGELRKLGLEGVARKFNKARTIRDNREYEVPALIYDVAKWGRWVAEQLRRDPDIRELYDEDVAVYIGTWEVRCPACGRHTPLVGNWWLARVYDSKKKWKALAWMEKEGEASSEGVGIRIVDAKKHKDYASKLDNIEIVKRGRRAVGVKLGGRTVYVGWDKLEGKPNVDARNETATCLNCGGEIGSKVKDPETGEKVWYVKHALRAWNRLLEEYLKRRATAEDLRSAPARPRLLAKVKIAGKGLEFEPASQEDNEKLWKALEKLRATWEDPDIPTEPLAGYESRSIWVLLYGFDKFYKLFNPRQLLTLVKLAKLIREAGKRVEEEKLKEGWTREEVHRYAEAVATYLAIALLKHINYNSIVTSTEPTQKFLRESLAFRGIAMTWNWVEEIPYVNVIGSFTRSIGSIIDGLSYLVSAVSGSPSRVRVLLDDARYLERVSDVEFDVIVTDPPYYDDVPYTELSDFYYVWLKRALSDVEDGEIKPRFHADAFFDEHGNTIETQWSTFARDEITLNVQRYEHFRIIERNNAETAKLEAMGKEVYAKMLAQAFETLVSRLKDGGLLVTYFAHTDKDAWESLVYAAWKRAGLAAVAASPMVTESEESVVARGKAAITASVVVAWHRLEPAAGECNLQFERDRIVGTLAEQLERYLSPSMRGTTLYVMLYAKALSELTRYPRVRDGSRSLDVGDLVVEASRLVAKAVVRGVNPKITSPEATLYLLFKLVGVVPKGAKRRRLPSSDAVMLGYGTLALGEAVGLGILRELTEEEEAEETGGAEVSKRKLYELLESSDDSEDSVLELLSQKGVDPNKPGTIKTSVDTLHVLELFVDRPMVEFRERYLELVNSVGWYLVEEAAELAKAIVHIAERGTTEDPEAQRCSRLISMLQRLGTRGTGEVR